MANTLVNPWQQWMNAAAPPSASRLAYECDALRAHVGRLELERADRALAYEKMEADLRRANAALQKTASVSATLDKTYRFICGMSWQSLPQKEQQALRTLVTEIGPVLSPKGSK